MVSQSIYDSNKPVVNLWFKEEWLINNGSVVYDFKGKDVYQSYFNLLQVLLISQLKNFCKINIKTLGKNPVDTSTINICPIICPDLANLKYHIENLDYDLYNMCAENNIIYFLGLMREHLETKTEGVKSIEQLIQKNIVDRGCSSKHLKIYHLGYGIPPELAAYKDYIVSVDSCNRLLSDVTSTKIMHNLPLERSYTFSVLAGSLRNRHYRCIFLARCKDLDILNDNFFYTMVMNNPVDDLQSIKDNFSDDYIPYRPIVSKYCDTLFYNKTYDKEGNPLVNKTVYDDKIEFDVPKQVLDSYVHIVLETQFNSPSITEKIYKPLMVGLPFIWHGPQNVLPYLTSLGYKKYKHIDYSFDAHPDPTVRMDLLIQEVQRLGKKDLRSLVKLNQDISEHNRKHFWNTVNNYNDLWTQLK
jgi:hypothetical protein